MDNPSRDDSALIKATELIDSAAAEPTPEGNFTLAALLIYPRYLEGWARHKQREVGVHKLRAIPFAGSLAGFRARHVIILKPDPESDAQEARYQEWLNTSVKLRLVPGCLENLHVVEI